MEIRTSGLVLRCFDQGESDRIVHLFTEELGRVSAIAKGALRSRRRFPGTLEILNLLELRLVDPPRAALMRLEGARLLAPFEGLVNDLGRYAISCQLLELLDRLTPEREAQPELFHFAVGVLDVLRQEQPDRLFALLVLAKTISRLGYRPQLASCAACGRPLRARERGVEFDVRQGGAVCAGCRDGDQGIAVPGRLLLALEAGIRSRLADRTELELARRDLTRLELLVDRFVRFHLGPELRSTSFLRSVLGSASLDHPSSRGNNLAAAKAGGARARVRPHGPSEPRAI